MAGYFRIPHLALAFTLATTAAAWCAGAPYGANGLGAVIDDNTGRSRGMGGAGVASTDGLNMLRSNPALISTFDHPAYGIGMLYTRSSTATGKSGTYSFARTDPSLIRFVLPLHRKLSLGWGIAPYTRADAKIETAGQTGETQYTDVLTSSGGINVSSFELATKFNMFSVGAAVNYYFGSAQEEWLRDFHGAPDLNNTTDYVRKQYKGYGATVGFLARLPRNISIGAGYTTPTTLDLTTYVRPGDSTNPEQMLNMAETDLPASIRLGAAAQLSRHFSAAVDLSQAKWSSAARTDKEKQMYNDTYSLGAGVRYVPTSSMTSGYLSTVPLSAGFRFGTLYYKSYPEVNPVREAALTLGAEFPFLNGGGSLITSCEVGKRGDSAKNGWDETFFNVGVSLVGGIK